ncbi:MAG: formylglycine-generating enzyme family protein [Candidatus Stygibacter australis]|nr:formylglycine-generating enzyme family protein [Candidatus Stygibacter australis]
MLESGFSKQEKSEYDYDIMKNEVTNQNYLIYLQSALLSGDVNISSTSISGYYDGDEYYSAGEYDYYRLDADGRISWDGTSLILDEEYEDHPVVEISWFGANAYAEYYGWRLPTEYEWEKAARGMTGFNYPWGINLTGFNANYSNSGDPWDNGTSPVGYFNGQNNTFDSHSPYGCYDMCGNVWEWTNSWFSEESDARVIRGGHWGSLSYFLLMWYRLDLGPSYHGEVAGFRCASYVER